MRSWISAGLAVLCVAASHPLLSAEPARITFKKTQLDAAFRSEGVAVADFNGDGRKDIAAGSVYYAGPDWKMHSIREEPKEFSIQQYSDAFRRRLQSRRANGSDRSRYPGHADLVV